MFTAPALLSLLILLSHSGWTNALCNLENGTVARCHQLGDIKYIETYELESLKAPVGDKVLSPELFKNLSSLRHLDVSGGELERVEPGSFRKLANLRSLDLADNRIGYLDLGSLDGLNHLRSLNLRRNNLRQLPPALARLKVLRHLDVLGNPLQCNCATLRVRDLVVKRGVKMSKKIVCAGPNNMKGTPMLKPDAAIICAFEEQDYEMQKDEPAEGSGDELGSGDVLDELDDDEEYVDVSASPETTREPEVETPFPHSSESTSGGTSSQEASAETTASSTSVMDSLEKTTDEDEEIFFDIDDKRERTTATSHATDKKQEDQDHLFYPVEGSGDEEEGSGEGSGTGMIFKAWSEDDEHTGKNVDAASTTSDSLFDILFSSWWSTAAPPEEKKDPDLEEEQFINVSSPKEVVENAVTRKMNPVEAGPTTAEATTKDSLFVPTSEVVLVDSNELDDSSELGKVKASEEGFNDELADVSPARQSKKGMGSYVVLAALLAILATLIGFAAYKGDFCKKKRKRSDVENGTEMKDMQKALLDTGNAQPKIAPNGNVESVPLVEGDHEKDSGERQTATDVPKSLNGISDHGDPAKPPRKIATPQEERKIDEQQDACSFKDDSLSGRTSSGDPSANSCPIIRHPEHNGPPLSPGAQRVKITLQENPDSVPRTPILITRTMAGENLVKTP